MIRIDPGPDGVEDILGLVYSRRVLEGGFRVGSGNVFFVKIRDLLFLVEFQVLAQFVQEYRLRIKFSCLLQDLLSGGKVVIIRTGVDEFRNLVREIFLDRLPRPIGNRRLIGLVQTPDYTQVIHDGLLAAGVEFGDKCLYLPIMQVVQGRPYHGQCKCQQHSRGYHVRIFVPGGLAFEFLDELRHRLAAVFTPEGEGMTQRAVLFFVQALDWGGYQAVFHRGGGRQLIERVFSSQQFVGNTTQCIGIVAGIGFLAFKHLQAGIGRSQGTQFARVKQGFLCLTGNRVLDCARDAEVQGLDGAVVAEEGITRLEVRMHQPPFVGVFQG